MTRSSADWRPAKAGKPGMFSEKEIKKFMDRHTRLGPDECWPWNYHRNNYGHGRMWAAGRNTLATHIALHLAGKPRPQELFALHSCDNPKCVNPAHLRWGTQLENIQDRVDRGRNGRARGEKAGRSKLNRVQVLEIRSDERLNGLIAAEYGVTKANVVAIKRGKIWGWLNGMEADEAGKALVPDVQSFPQKQARPMPQCHSR